MLAGVHLWWQFWVDTGTQGCLERTQWREADLDSPLPSHCLIQCSGERGEILARFTYIRCNKSYIASEEWVVVSPHLLSCLEGGEGQAEHVLWWTAVRVEGEPWGRSHQQRGMAGSYRGCSPWWFILETNMSPCSSSHSQPCLKNVPSPQDGQVKEEWKLCLERLCSNAVWESLQTLASATPKLFSGDDAGGEGKTVSYLTFFDIFFRWSL